MNFNNVFKQINKFLDIMTNVSLDENVRGKICLFHSGSFVSLNVVYESQESVISSSYSGNSCTFQNLAITSTIVALK